MSTPREVHLQVVHSARVMVEQLQNNLAVDRGRHDEILELVADAVGHQPVSDSGRAALEGMIAAGTRTDELLGLLEEIKNRLEEYGGTF
jgi:hypothetical protein